jgi:ABC-type transport system substrate-binding protein
MSLRTRRTLALFTATMMVAVACQAAPTATPTADPGTPGTPPAAETPATTPPAAETPATTPPAEETPATTPPAEETPATETPAASPPAGDQSLVYVIDGEITFLSNANNDVPTSEAVQWLYSGLYQYNDALEPVPDLATGEPEISEDGLTWTITMREDAYFQPTGEQVTAQDVVFTYEMSMNPNCRFNPSVCLANVAVPPPDDPDGEPQPVLDSVRAVDDFTVEFVLNFPYAPFITVMLPGHLIDSQSAVEESYGRFEQAAAAVEPEEVADLQGRIDDEMEAEEPDVIQFRSELEDILQRAGVELPSEEAYTFEGEFDEDAYTQALASSLSALADALAAEAADAIAAAYPLLDIQRSPVGSGPFYVTEFNPGQNLVLARNEQYHEGVPQLSQMFLPIIKDAVAQTSALLAGDVDWVFSVEADQVAAVEGSADVKLAEYADFAFFGVQFNLREESLFSDLEMRQAAAHCIDKEAMVDAATEGQAVVIHADLPPASWAYNPDIEVYEQDVERANQLIQGLGYEQGADGVYERDGERLETTILVRAGQPSRIAFMQFFADALNTDCGWDITVQEADFATVLLPMLEWPHRNPPTGRQFDAYFGGWGTGFDPDPYAIWHSSQCTTPDQPDTYNYICFQNEEADRLIEQQVVELDQDARTELLHQFEAILAEELPYLFAWSPIGREGLRTTVNSTDQEWTPEVMDTPTWFWEMHKITNAR